MSKIKTVFSDLGGVILTDGWDRVSRQRAAERFNLDWEELEGKHAPLFQALDTGHISFNDYLAQVVFDKQRQFSLDQFVEFVKAESRIIEPTYDVIIHIALSQRFKMCTLSNDCPELTDYRIRQFNLGDYFDSFFASGYLGVRKPERAIYEIALKVSNTIPSEAVFIDDRQENLTVPRQLGMHVIHVTDAESTKNELASLGVWALSLASGS